MKTQPQKTYGMQPKHREVHSDTSLSQKTRKLSNNLNYHLKDSEKEEQAKPKLSKRKEVIKDERRNKTEIK